MSRTANMVSDLEILFAACSWKCTFRQLTFSGMCSLKYLFSKHLIQVAFRIRMFNKVELSHATCLLCKQLLRRSDLFSMKASCRCTSEEDCSCFLHVVTCGKPANIRGRKQLCLINRCLMTGRQGFSWFALELLMFVYCLWPV